VQLDDRGHQAEAKTNTRRIILSERQKRRSTASRSCSLMPQPVSVTRTMVSLFSRNNSMFTLPPSSPAPAPSLPRAVPLQGNLGLERGIKLLA
jgi:hypothetical protein